jgi:hypothetical protein
MNLAYYGFSLNQQAYNALVKLNPEALVSWWGEIETEMKEITGSKRKIADFVVYKNSPSEVLSKTEGEYWIPQILMYFGFPNEMFTETVKPRPKMKEQPKLTLLRLAKLETLQEILDSLIQAPARWKPEELADVLFLSQSLTA